MVQQNVCKPSSVSSWWHVMQRGLPTCMQIEIRPLRFWYLWAQAMLHRSGKCRSFLFLLLGGCGAIPYDLPPESAHVIPYLSRQCSEKWISAWLWGNNISLRPCQPTPNIPCPQNVAVSFHVISLYFYGRCRRIFHKILCYMEHRGATWSIVPAKYIVITVNLTVWTVSQRPQRWPHLLLSSLGVSPSQGFWTPKWFPGQKSDHKMCLKNK